MTRRDAPSPEAVPDEIVVGLDGSTAAINALRWATDAQKSWPKTRRVSVYGRHEAGLELHGKKLATPGAGTERSHAEAVLAEAERLEPDRPSMTESRSGRAGPRLVDASSTARLLVLGNRPSTAQVTHLAPVTSHCVQHSAVPVVVVPEHAAAGGPLRTIVVGVDGSPNSIEALQWATDQLIDNGLLVIIDALESDPADPSDEALRRRIAEVPARVPPAIGVEVKVKRGIPAEVLRTEAADADLLVVGARSHHGTDYLDVGSATISLLHRPPVPTVFVPTTAAPLDPDPGAEGTEAAKPSAVTSHV